MKVVTLGPEAFRRDCARLAQRAAAFAPELLIGIRTGGHEVAQELHDGLFRGIPLLPLTRRRASSAAKNANPLFRALMQRLPYAVTDRLRRLEHRLLARRRPGPATAAWEADPQELSAIDTFVALQSPLRILVVDDAVDSGETLRAVVALLRQRAPAASVRAAVIVVSTAQPLIYPDFHLYAQTLCRFPWSHDFRNTPRPAVRPR